MEIIFYFFIVIFGLIVGSFLNVVIYRLETGETVINGRSHCRHCRKNLAWHDLVPVLSFLVLKGKCGYCKKPISWQYPLVEITTGALFAIIFNFFFSGGFALGGQFLISFFYYLFIMSALVIIFVYDLRHYIIPDEAVYSAIGVAFLYKLFEVLEFSHWDLFGIWNFGFWNLLTIFSPFIAAIIAGTFFLSIVILTRGNGMGGGDIKLAFLMGLVLGADKIFVSLAIAFTLGAAIGIILIILKKKTLKSAIPFGPFLVIGTIVGLLLQFVQF